MTAHGREAAVRAAGCVLWRPARAAGSDGIEVGLVHRPKYDDWSLPKGKVDPGEHIVACAIREVLEETGHAVGLGSPLGIQRYPVVEGPKEVLYWAARGDDAAAPWPGTAEIDRLEFVSAARADSRLTHPRDAELVQAAVSALGVPPLPTTPLIVLRHAKALPRKRWRLADADRPLDPKGIAQSDRLSVLLACFGIERIVSSDSLRCVDTVRPFATASRRHVELEPRVSEEAHEDCPDVAVQAIRELMADPRPTVVCSHRPVLPTLFAALGALPLSPFQTPPVLDEPLATGSFVVVHRRSDSPAGDGALPITAVERHEP
jgi:8-oxo-(d)GTP phosphatase